MTPDTVWGASPAPRQRSRSLWWAVGSVGLVVVLAAVAAVVWIRHRDGEGSAPRTALLDWLAAAESGDPDRVRAAVAPSQRALVDPADPTGTGLGRFHLEAKEIGRGGPSAWRQDDVMLEVARVVACAKDFPDDADLSKEPSCRWLVGTGPDRAARVVRENGRWWAVALPLRVLEGSGGGQVNAVVRTRIQLTGGLTFDETQEQRLPGKTCAAWRWSSFSVFGLLSSQGSLTLDVDRSDVTAPALPRTAVVLSIDIEHRYLPVADVPITRAADGSRGSLTITDWVDHPLLDAPKEPVSGTVTWTCRLT